MGSLERVILQRLSEADVSFYVHYRRNFGHSLDASSNVKHGPTERSSVKLVCFNPLLPVALTGLGFGEAWWVLCSLGL